LAVPRYLSFDLGRIGARLGFNVWKDNVEKALLNISGRDADVENDGWKVGIPGVALQPSRSGN
jgi:hypothetical protein